jgi:hypothetical protein
MVVAELTLQSAGTDLLEQRGFRPVGPHVRQKAFRDTNQPRHRLLGDQGL